MSTPSFRPSVETLERRDTPTAYTVTAPGAGGAALVRVYDTASGALVRELAPFDGFTGGAQVASGDLNGDGVPDIVAAAGPGGGPHVRAFDGVTFEEIASFFPYDPGFTGGVGLSVGDVNADGFADIVCGTGVGGGPHVKVFSGQDSSLLTEFFPYDPGFRGGVLASVGDVNADGMADIVTGVGEGGGPHVKVYSGQDTALLTEFFPYDPGFRGGVNVAVGDLNGDGVADIITGTGVSGGPHVRTFLSDENGRPHEGGQFFAYDPGFRGGVRVASTDLNGDGMADIITTPGPGGGPHFRGFGGMSGADLGRDFFAYDPGFTGGVYVGGGGQRDLVVQPINDLTANVTALGTLGSSALSAGGSVSADRPFAVYSFRVTGDGSARVDLSGLSADADVQLIHDQDADGEIDGDDVIAESDRGGIADEALFAGVEAGTYFVRVLRFDGETSFRLRVSQASATSSSAADLGALGSRRQTGRVTEADPEAEYKFTLSRTTDFAASLFGLTDDADLFLKGDPDGDGVYTEISRSDLGGTQADQLSEQLSAGSYLVLVRRCTGDTNFTLDLQASAAAAPGVTNLGTFAGTTVGRTGVVSEAEPEDVYQFTLTGSRRVTLGLTNLTADADLYLLGGGATPDVASELGKSVEAGTANDSVTATLAAGTYFITVRRYDGSPSYALTLRTASPGESVAGDSLLPISDFGPYDYGSGLAQAERAVELATGRTFASRTLTSANGSNFRDLNQIQAGGAWNAGFTGSGVTVAVIDSGVNTAHRDLTGSVVRTSRRYDFVQGDNTPQDGTGHGSHVAGTIGANRDGQGITGVAYDATIMPIRILNNNGSTVPTDRKANTLARAINFAVDNGARVINLSIGSSQFQSTLVRDALRRARDNGVVVVVASGNDSASAASWPARYARTLSNVIAVGRVSGDNAVAPSSNRAGNPFFRQFVVAPGTRITSLARVGDGTEVKNGTSMAAPHVAGIAALVRQANPNLTAAQVVDIIVRSATTRPFVSL